MLIFFDAVFVTLALWTFAPVMTRVEPMRLATRLVPAPRLLPWRCSPRAPFLIDTAPIRVDDGPGPADLLFPRAGGADACSSARSCAASRARCFSCAASRRPITSPLAAAELAVVFGVIVLVTGPLWARKAWGIWWDWDAAADQHARHVDDVRGVSAAAPVRRRRIELLSAAVGLFGMALVPFVYCLGELLAHAAPEDHGGADAAAR